MTSLPQVLVNVRVGHRVPDVADRLAEEIAATAADLGTTGRVLVRASGTEPLIRVMVEAEDETLLNEVAETVSQAVQDAA